MRQKSPFDPPLGTVAAPLPLALHRPGILKPYAPDWRFPIPTLEIPQGLAVSTGLPRPRLSPFVFRSILAHVLFLFCPFLRVNLDENESFAIY
jgi:hypothetical protein